MSRIPGRDLIEAVLAQADIRINGRRPFDIKVLDDRFYERAARDGDLGLGEAYVNGWWECEAVDQLTARFIRSGLHKNEFKNLRFAVYYLRMLLSGIGRRSKAFEVGQRHYDLGNDLFTLMLDRRMIYSCAYWKDAATLDEAQEHKLDLICRKIGLRPRMRVLEIGCGWGGWARFAAERYGVDVIGLTVSREQQQFAQAHCAGLPVEIRLQDYRDANGTFDRVVSIAMFEAVGHRYYRTFMQVVDRCLADDGLFFLHTIVGQTHMGPAQARWLNEYIFPNGELPALAQIMRAAENLFVVETAHHFGADYERTLAEWHANFTRGWPQIKDRYGDRFYRIWTFYLLLSRGIFQARLAHVWQFVFSKRDIPGRLIDVQLPDVSAIDIR